ncbi:ChbG/HpnK family deacetylase [Sphingobium sp. CR2-8]|uniref:ChbG/HpnK family deacetylase n=1 Tax=Sphingobium sp. CR2-8 TaxID=1306534 RepID=UPI002DB798F5|nr:ChbG/HpnK family deacetylase [Sphingobium sp. CR2-8]MEC3909054.1 ChbG/HpnK family deacetylase [Sphingobium sp. CR2-8]
MSKQTTALNQRLGFRAEDRLLIVNCDDVGSSHSANVAALRAMTSGVATSASLMVPCPWAAEAARMFDGLPVGVHLTLTSEHAGYRWRSLTGGASLRDASGFLPATTATALSQQDLDEVRAECRAQVDTAIAWGVDVTHIDTHMDVLHANQALFAIYLDLASEIDVPVRLPLQSDFPARELSVSRGVLSVDHLIYTWPLLTRDVIFEVCPTLPCGVTELFAHPVLDGKELRGYDLHHADIRVHDAAALIDPSVAALLDENMVHRISYRELRALQRTTNAVPPI